jgi:hypothetical protein
LVYFYYQDFKLFGGLLVTQTPHIIRYLHSNVQFIKRVHHQYYISKSYRFYWAKLSSNFKQQQMLIHRITELIRFAAFNTQSNVMYFYRAQIILMK